MMDDILESVHFEKFFKALKRSMSISAGVKASWQNPSAAMVVGHVNFSQWGREHPEEIRAIANKASLAAKRQREEKPGAFLASRNLTGISQYWEENPEAKAERDRNLIAGSAKWREEHVEEFRANTAKLCSASAKGRQTSRQNAIQRSSERFQSIKSFIPEAGIRICDLRKLAPKWSQNQLEHLLKRAVQRGDVIRVGGKVAKYKLAEISRRAA